MKANTSQLNFANAVMTGTTTIVSDPIPLDQIYGFAIQAIYTGTPIGSIKLQASSDAPLHTSQTSNGGPDVVTNWVDIANSQYTIAGTGQYMWNYNGAFFRYVRIVYTNTSGVGHLAAEICIKGV